jgi:hypothetical protein
MAFGSTFSVTVATIDAREDVGAIATAGARTTTSGAAKAFFYELILTLGETTGAATKAVTACCLAASIEAFASLKSLLLKSVVES